jgi:hypothetical protein
MSEVLLYLVISDFLKKSRIFNILSLKNRDSFRLQNRLRFYILDVRNLCSSC